VAERHGDLGRWIRLSAGYRLDPRIVRAGPLAELVYVRGLTFAREQGSDGHIAREQYRQLCQGLGRVSAAGALESLLREGLWEECADGWRVPYDRWARWQDTNEDRVALREIERKRKAEWRARKAAEQEES
jgi:hypothetical protein